MLCRVCSTGIPNKIQISQQTADILISAGKGHWVKPREDAVRAKGKGVLNTFWLTLEGKKGLGDSSRLSESPASSSSSSLVDNIALNTPREDLEENLKTDRLVDWVVDILQLHAKKIIAQQGKARQKKGEELPTYQPEAGSTALDEVVEVITLPNFDAKAVAKAENYRHIELDPMLSRQLRDYVQTIASMYRNNPFHNFAHACHVTMAVNKLLKRIVTPDLDEEMKSENELASQLHAYTHGINSDPLTIFAIVFSALIHDVDHRGIPNTQLIVEESEMASRHKNKSVAEQNSLEVSWTLLMSDEFKELRRWLFATEAELLRFRQVIVNVVLATDIFDKELNDLRKKRWLMAFSEEGARLNGDNDLRATIVIEHIIQASDVAHTMQHWHVYCKWNKRLFQEMYLAYCQGRMSKDPSKFWYNGEIEFFDNYIIPLAKKLKDCNVFGVSSDECLNYALKNRAEWEERGRELVADMVDDVTKMNFY